MEDMVTDEWRQGWRNEEPDPQKSFMCPDSHWRDAL